MGADGSQAPVNVPGIQELEWYDSERDENCGFARAADGVVRCLPDTREARGLFSDSGCTERVAIVLSVCGAPLPKYAYFLSSGAAQATSAVAEVVDLTCGAVGDRTPDL